MTSFIIGDLLTGRRIQTLNVSSGSWTDTLNAAGSIGCTVSLRDPVNRGIGLGQSAAVGKSFLAAVEGTQVLQAGPIWVHDYDRDAQTLQLTASGMWSYFDHRVLLPVLAGRLPTDPTTNTRFSVVSTDPADPWPTDTSKSWQGIVRALVAQAQSWTGGNVPVTLPTEITGSEQRTYLGSDLGFVGGRIADITGLQNGPDVRFVPKFTSDNLGIQWALTIGTPTQPLLFSAIDVVFKVSASKSTVTALKVNTDGTKLAAQGFASGGRQSGEAIASVSTDPTLLSAGYPLLDAVDSSHQTVSIDDTLQEYSDALVSAGKSPVGTWTFTHDASQGEPFLGSFSAGDFARVRIRNDPYIPDGEHRMRITQISGDEGGAKLPLVFQHEVVS